jgi:hypothetical protein
MNLTRIKGDLTIYGVINIILYMCGSFLLLPFMKIYLKTDISLLNYIVWYIWSILYTLYVLYILNTKPNEQTNIENVTYNWFIKGGLSSYQDMFLLSEKEPLYEYGMLGVLLLIPVSTHLSMKRKAEVILLKVAIFHIISSLLLMDWNNLIVNYNFRKVK